MGLGAARRAIFGSVPWQRCQFHLQQNAGAYVPRQSMRFEVAADIRSIFNAPDRRMADSGLQWIIAKYAKAAPRLAAWWEEELPDGFAVIEYSLEHRRTLRTTNCLERLNKEIRRRTKVVGVFPNVYYRCKLSTGLALRCACSTSNSANLA